MAYFLPTARRLVVHPCAWSTHLASSDRTCQPAKSAIERGAMGRSAANRVFLVGLGGLLLIAAGCNRSVSGSGTVTSTPIPVPASGFSRLEVSSSFDVNVSFGDQENVTLRVDDNVVGHLGRGRVGRDLTRGPGVRNVRVPRDPP